MSNQEPSPSLAPTAMAQILSRWKRFISRRYKWISLSRTYCVTTIFLLACLGMTEVSMAGSGYLEQGNALDKALNEHLIAQGICKDNLSCNKQLQIYRSDTSDHIYLFMYGQTDKTLAGIVAGFVVAHGFKITSGIPITLRVFEGPITQYLGFIAMVSKSQESIKLEINK